ncbi:hypothetical protein TNCV_1414551 [Trichonephila clavipes]|nr:hypothetical protein TNCV_1414551 [Trichonephila clavipes]
MVVGGLGLEISAVLFSSSGTTWPLSLSDSRSEKRFDVNGSLGVGETGQAVFLGKTNAYHASFSACVDNIRRTCLHSRHPDCKMAKKSRSSDNYVSLIDILISFFLLRKGADAC